MEFQPVTTVAAFRLLDEGEVLEGYLDGVSAGPAPGSDRSRSYWHGWHNGQVDAGLAPIAPAQAALNKALAMPGH